MDLLPLPISGRIEAVPDTQQCHRLLLLHCHQMQRSDADALGIDPHGMRLMQLRSERALRALRAMTEYVGES